MSRGRQAKSTCHKCGKFVGRLSRHLERDRCHAQMKSIRETRASGGAQPKDLGGPTFQERLARIKQENYEARQARRAA